MAKASKIRGGNGLHIEAEGCIVNIIEGIHDIKGRAVTAIEILPDNHYAGERIWITQPKYSNIRVIQLKKKYIYL